jgi:hypothetical protein
VTAEHPGEPTTGEPAEALPHCYFDPDGNPITVEEWGPLYQDAASRVVFETTIARPGRAAVTIRTMYLGFVDHDSGAHLYGTVLADPARPGELDSLQEIDVHDDRDTARIRHMLHVYALVGGHHCGMCAEGEPHFDGSPSVLPITRDGP